MTVIETFSLERRREIMREARAHVAKHKSEVIHKARQSVAEHVDETARRRAIMAEARRNVAGHIPSKRVVRKHRSALPPKAAV